ncbi:hypothetical protein FNP20_000589 [Enterococcus faecium]|nr:hypothetical protein [Enterococcus faecium]
MKAKKNAQICFISSDTRDLYAEDIFRVMAAPESYIIKFRYRYELIKEVNRIKENMDVIIYSLVGTQSDENKLELIPIRKAKIKDIEKQNDFIEYYLELKEFVRLTSENKKIECEKPPQKIVSIITDKNLEVEPCLWEKKVEELFALDNNNFRDRLMYKIEKLEVRKFCERWKNVPLKGKNTYVCYSNSDYKLIINLKKSSDENYILNINCDKDILKDILEFISLDAPRDKVTNRFYTGYFNTDQRYSQLIFRNTPQKIKVEDSNKYDFKINIKLKKRKFYSILFGLLIGILTAVTKYNGIITFSKVWNKSIPEILDYSFLPLIIGLISGFLFHKYDKK